MPAPAPPRRRACRSADVQAGAPPDSVTVPEATELAAGLDAALEPLGLAPPLDAPELALAGALEELAPPPVAAGALEVLDAAQPAARSPALISGTTSSAFFTRSPLLQPSKRCSDVPYDAAASDQVGANFPVHALRPVGWPTRARKRQSSTASATGRPR